jgi:CheY-like chemotaxis protein
MGGTVRIIGEACGPAWRYTMVAVVEMKPDANVEEHVELTRGRRAPRLARTRVVPTTWAIWARLLGATKDPEDPIDQQQRDSAASSREEAKAKPSALIVEDERDLREMLAEVMVMEGYHVATARNGREALELMSSAPPAIVLLDLMMPVMNGWEVLEHLQRHDSLREIPVIVLSAHPIHPEGVLTLPKPYKLDVLLGTVQRLLQERQA